MKSRYLLVVTLIASLTSPWLTAGGFAAVPQAPASDAARLVQLETRLEALRQELKIPAYSAAVVKDQKVIWAKGFGFADLENKIPATEHTAYHLASLTKTFASTILMQLVQEGKIKLDDPVTKYGINLESNGVIQVKHLFSHTSEGVPGEQYRYNGNRFAELDKVVEKATGKSYSDLLIANILEPLGMTETAPNVPRVVNTRSPAGADPAAEADVKAAVTDLISGYNSGNIDQIQRRVASPLNGFEGPGGFLTAFVDLAEIREGLQSGFKLNFAIHDLETAVYGDTAVTTFIMGGTVTPPNRSALVEGPWRSSLVWNKQNGIWKLIHGHQSALKAPVISEKRRERFAAITKILAQPYGLDKEFQPTKIRYPGGFSTSAGLISTVLDMAKYDIAIDQNKFLNKETQQLAFTPTVSTKGEALPYGLGWFTQDYKGTKLIWHYGYWTGNSSFILKVPERNLTFIIMANSDNLSRPTALGSGDALSSPVGMAFLKAFVFPEKFGEAVPEINWRASLPELEQQLKQVSGKPYSDLFTGELMSKLRIYQSVGRIPEAVVLLTAYGKVYSKPVPTELTRLPLIAQIAPVADNEDKTVTFALPGAQQVRIFAIGEGETGQMFDYGWIEDADKGLKVWEMDEPKTTRAGGVAKNRKVDAVITLPAGNYKLRYKSDDSHSFDHWNALPPDILFWGIAVYKN